MRFHVELNYREHFVSRYIFFSFGQEFDRSSVFNYARVETRRKKFIAY